MSVRTDVVNLIVNINGNQSQAQLNNLRKKAADLKLEMQGLTKGTAEYAVKAKELQSVTKDMDALKKQIGITSLSQKELVAELNKLKALKGSVAPFTKEFKELDAQIKLVDKRLYDVRNGVQGFASFFSKIKDEVKQFGVVAAGYLGFQFITSQFSNVIRGAGKTSDQLADLQRSTGLTAGEVKKLNDEFKEFDTRTSTETLRSIANIAARLGVGKDDIAGFTKEFDKLVVVLGNSLGDADAAATTLGKILNVFDGKITGDNISRLGNAIVSLDQSGVASGAFLADFAQRLSGVSKNANISLGSLLGLGAGIEEMGGRVESGSTAIQKIITSIASDIPKAAKIAGVEVKQFGALFAKAPEEALIRFAEGLVKNQKSFADITASFKDAGEEGARVVTTLSNIGNSGDLMRKRIADANIAIKDTAVINDGFALKNENFAATLDKLGKEFNRLVASPGVTNFLKGAIEGALGFIKIVTAIPAGLLKFTFALGSLIVAVALFNSGMVQSAKLSLVQAARTVLITTASYAAAVALTVYRLAMSAATASQAAYIVISNLFTGSITAATAATRLFNIAIKTGLGPIGLLIAVVGAVVVAVGKLKDGFTDVGKQAKFYAESVALANEEISKQQSEIDTLTAVVKDHNISLNTREESLKKLIAISPEYLGRLTLENIETAEGKRILDTYNDSLQTTARLKAAQGIKDREFNKVVKLQTIKQELEIAQKSGAGFGDLSSDAQKAFSKISTSVGRTAFSSDLFNRSISKSDFAEAFKDLDDEIAKATEGTNAATQNFLDQQKDAENKRRNFLYEQVKIAELAVDEAKKGTKEYETAKLKLLEAQAAFDNEFGEKKKNGSNNGGGGTGGGSGTGGGKKTGNNEFANLKKDAAAYLKELQELKKRAVIKGEEPEQGEIDAVNKKYADLLERAKEYYIKQALSKKQFNDSEKLIEEAQRQELQNIFDKYYKKRFAEGAEKEYEDSLAARREFADNYKIAAANDYADGLISKQQYEQRLKQIEADETADRIIIATDYSATVKKAAADVTQFKKQQEKQQTDDLIEDAEKRKEISRSEALAKAQRGVLTATPGSDARVEANKKLLQLQFDQETEFLDKKSELYKLKQEELNQSLKELEQQATLDKIEQITTYVDYFQSALSSLTTFINNRENRLLQKEKAGNDVKRKGYKDQLDNKLISQQVYDKKIQALQEEEDKRNAEIKRRQAKREKALNLFNAIVNTSAAIIKALVDPGGFAGLALSIGAGITGALQIAAIANTPLPQAAKGGFFTNVKSHAQGGHNIEIENNEAVMAAAAMEDQKRYTVTGTTKQITSALNSKAGGVNWAGGAIIKQMKFGQPGSQLSSSLPSSIQSNNGLVRNLPQSNERMEAIMSELLDETRTNTFEIATMKKELGASVSLKEIRKQGRTYDAAKKASGL